MAIRTYDFLVIGGGVIGLNIAIQLRSQFHGATVALIDKEKSLGVHASGRNSGVLHAGFYYSSDSLKARFCRDGNKAMREYCDARSIPVNHCGKLVVASNERELATLDMLDKRGQINNIDVHLISLKEAREIEPRVKTVDKALFSPSTAVVNPMLVMHSMQQDAVLKGVDILLGATYRGKLDSRVVTSIGEIESRYVINAAGLYADRIAKNFGAAMRYKMLPFKGLYLYSKEPPGSFRTNIYPVPDLRNPFLGVHITVTADGAAKIGPTAIPVFWRESYTALSNFRTDEFLDITVLQLRLFLKSDFDFRRLAFEELRKYSGKRLVRLAQNLAEGVRHENYLRRGRPGIRAQLYDTEKERLEMDFVLEFSENSLHILNAVSPAFTCSLPFSRYVVEELSKRWFYS